MIAWLQRKLQEYRELQCAKVGHHCGVIERKGIVESHLSAIIAFRVTERRMECRRCHLALSEWRRVLRRPMEPEEISESDYDVLEKEGVLWDR